MLALRSIQGPDELPERHQGSPPEPDKADWLSMHQAACELGVSISTVRRMIRGGRLRNRVVPHRGGFAYLIYLPNSRHSHMLAGARSVDARKRLRLVDRALEDRHGAIPTDLGRIAALETQVERLSDALSRALRLKQRDLPVGIGDPAQRTTDPYARYRWLVRRRWWWPF